MERRSADDVNVAVLRGSGSATRLEALAAHPLGNSVSDVVDIDAAFAPDLREDPGHVIPGLQQPVDELVQVGAVDAHPLPHMAG